MNIEINSLEDLEKYFLVACISSDLALLKYLYSNSIYLEALRNQSFLHSGLICACKNGNIRIIDFLINQQNITIEDEDYIFKNACEEGQLKIVKYLIEDYNIFNNREVFKPLQESLNICCYKGKTNVLQYLLKNEDLEEEVNTNQMFKYAALGKQISILNYLLTLKKIKTPDLHHNDNEVFLKSCLYGNLNIVKYFLEKKSFIKNFNINSYDGEAIINSCLSNNKELIEFLIKFNSFNDPLDIHIRDEFVFIYLVKNKIYDIINYLILDKEINITPKMEKYIQDNNLDYIKNLISIKKLDTKNKKISEINKI